MKKLQFNQLKINTDLEDTANLNKNSNAAIGINNPNIEGINQQSIRNSKTMTATLNLNTLSPKNFSVLQTTKTNKITEFNNRPSNKNITGTTDYKRSFVDNRNDYKSSIEKTSTVGNNFGTLIGSLSPKIPNGIISKNSKISSILILLLIKCCRNYVSSTYQIR
jgi:hypothetical protein